MILKCRKVTAAYIVLCLTGDVERCRQLLDAGVDPYAIDKNANGMQALHWAVFKDRYVRTGIMGDQFRDPLKPLERRL